MTLRWKQQVCFISGYITPLQHCHILFESSLHLQNNGSKLNLNLFHKSQFTFKLRLNRKYLSRLSPRAAWTIFCRKTNCVSNPYRQHPHLQHQHAHQMTTILQMHYVNALNTLIKGCIEVFFTPPRTTQRYSSKDERFKVNVRLRSNAWKATIH